MFQSNAHHLQGELMYSLHKTIDFYKTTVCSILVALVYSTFTMVKYLWHVILYVTNLKKSVIIVKSIVNRQSCIFYIL